METTYPVGLMWFRRDLRGHDNAALCQALSACRKVHCVFIFDTQILAELPRRDRRVEFIRQSLIQLDSELKQLAGSAGAGLIVSHAAAVDEIPRLTAQLGAAAVFTNHDDEARALRRDNHVRAALAGLRVAFHTFKDHVVFERRELLTQAGSPYSVFTPYKRAWLARVRDADLAPRDCDAHATHLAERPASVPQGIPSLDALGFESGALDETAVPAGADGGRRLFADFLDRMSRYQATRDFPGIKGPSYLSVHLRFGTVSIRRLAAEAHRRATQGDEGAATWLGELIWRDFYVQVLSNFPHVSDEAGTSHSFRREYDAIQWEEGPQADALFSAWCEGRTGYPLVDAAMAQINQTGYMHNRLRMVTASFLCKDLGLDWRRGERYFADKLIDFDLAANNGGWQWASSSGCDAQPWFRIFNPVSQSRKFDPQANFILRYLPQLAALPLERVHEPWTASPIERSAVGDYPPPIVDHEQARQRTLQRYEVVRNKS